MTVFADDPVWGQITTDTPFDLALHDAWLTITFAVDGREQTIAISKFAVLDLLEQQAQENGAAISAIFEKAVGEEDLLKVTQHGGPSN